MARKNCRGIGAYAIERSKPVSGYCALDIPVQ
jgi:hypothetical protein